jgi:hypothetical protein
MNTTLGGTQRALSSGDPADVPNQSSPGITQPPPTKKPPPKVPLSSMKPLLVKPPPPPFAVNTTQKVSATNITAGPQIAHGAGGNTQGQGLIGLSNSIGYSGLNFPQPPPIPGRYHPHYGGGGAPPRSQYGSDGGPSSLGGERGGGTPGPPSGGPGGPPGPPPSGPPTPPPPPPASGGPNTGGSSRADSYKSKFSIKDYTDYKDIADFPTWIDDTSNAMYAQDVGELLDPSYAPDPNDPNEVRSFNEKQNSMYFVLSKKVRTPTGRQIVQQEKRSRNAQAVLYHLINEGTTSTKAILTGRTLLKKIITARYDPSKTTTAVDFISGLEKAIETYNDHQQDPTCVLSGMIPKNLLQNAFSQVPYLRDVATREQEMVTHGFPALNYDDYKNLLQSSSMVYDETRLTRARTSMNFVNTNAETPEDNQDNDEMNPEFSVNVSTGKINRTSISEDCVEGGIDTEDNQDCLISEKEFTVMKTEINDVTSKARKKAQPADVRRIMDKKKTAQVKSMTILEDDHEESSYNDNELDYLLNQDWDDDEEDFHRGD